MGDRELRIRFDGLDVNGSGFLEEDDFEAVARLRIAAAGASQDSAKAAAVVAGYRRWWAGMTKDHLHRVTYEEYRSSLQGVDRFAANRRPQVEAVFDLHDTDNDGYLDEHQFVAGHVDAGFDEPDATRLFAVTDSDGDGKVSKEELVALLQQSCTGGPS